MSKYHIFSKCVQDGYDPQNGEPRVLPIYQSTTYKYTSSKQAADLFDLKVPGHIYSRISNPTVASVEDKIASLEGGVGALCTSSGQAATLIAILNLCNAGDHFISATSIYGGTINLFSVTLKKLGVDVTYVDTYASEEEIRKAFKPNTKLVFGETISNPTLDVLDIEKFAKLAHEHGVPLIVDNTFATPIMCRPFEFGADIVVHSTSKYMDGHAVAVGGVIVDSGNFDWDNGKFPGLTTPDESYHGLIYTKDFGNAAYINKARVQLMRDLGSSPSPQNAFLLNLGLETLHLRMERHCQNARQLAEYLTNNDMISWIKYPGLKNAESAQSYELVQKYLPNGTTGIISFGIEGGKPACVKFMDNLEMAAIVVHVADVRSSVLHPASTTHRQLTDEHLIAAGIRPDLIRFSVGIEFIGDIIDDIENALRKI